MSVDMERFIEYLKAHANGPECAKTRRTIEQALYPGDGHADRNIRDLANQANTLGLPVATCNEGYFWADGWQDFEPMLSRLRHQRDAMHNRIMAVERLREKRWPITFHGHPLVYDTGQERVFLKTDETGAVSVVNPEDISNG